ncbi:(S)-ureidoglycine aminohydrolase [Pseudodesulfovibrio indicus]|uniref:(S)-ureidoglycine aminohydrolase n=1 Tax=Pseudodesulfovibrio indicus TaxID=1716143 RepID=UPI001FD93B7D|nr:(S)-ureidoglycine aminohydrolase [Pseudodesulfovibrio indicus]
MRHDHPGLAQARGQLRAVDRDRVRKGPHHHPIRPRGGRGVVPLRPGRSRDPQGHRGRPRRDPGRRGYVYAPPGKGVGFASAGDAPVRILLYKQRFVPHPDPEMRRPWMVTGSIRAIEERFYDNMENVFVRDLLPVDEAFDMNFHTLAFLPGGCHPFVETHVQEHGAYIYEGQGLYLLDEEWIPVQTEDFLWFAPYCKQACYGTGLTRMEYIYSKDCHRDEAI